MLAAEDFQQHQAEVNGGAGAAAGEQAAVLHGGGVFHLGAAHLMLQSGVAHAALALGDAQLREQRGGGADGSHQLAVVPSPANDIPGGSAFFHGAHAAETAGEYDHVQLLPVNVLHSHIGLDGNAVAAGHQLPADSGKGHFHAATAENIAGGDGFHFFKSGTQ